MAYVKPVRPAIVLAKDKVKEFAAKDVNLEARKRCEKLSAEFRANNRRK